MWRDSECILLAGENMPVYLQYSAEFILQYIHGRGVKNVRTDS